MGATIQGKGRVFAKEHEGWTSYSLGISSKGKEGNWVNAYQPIRFKKGEGVPNGTEIEYTAFATVKERMVEGQTRNYVLWQILEYSIAGDITARPSAGDSFSALTQDDIPF